MDNKQLQINIDYFLENHFQGHIIDRGFRYFYNGSTSDLTLIDNKCFATVQGSSNYDVHLNLDDLRQSYCNCPYERNCKHMVAVLLELKKFLEDSVNVTFSNTSFQFDDLDLFKKQLTNDLLPYVDQVYKILSKQGHFSNEHSSYIVKQFFSELDQTNVTQKNQFKIIAMTVVIDELLKKAVNYDTYHFRQNRFLAFFNELINHGYHALKAESKACASPFYNWYTAFLFKHIKKMEVQAPYDKLITTWLLCEERETRLKEHAASLLTINNKSSFIIKLASLLYLQANDGARSLTLLKKQKTAFHYSELIDHFLIMEEKNDFVMMKHWFEIFFPFTKPKQGTILGKLYEEMLIETGTEEEKLTIVWKNWLTEPTFKSYQARIQKCSADEKEKVLQYILPELKLELYRPQIEAVFFQIVTEEELLEDGVHSLLTNKKDVPIFSPEIKAFLKTVTRIKPQLLLPFYHQLVERLVQKKSRIHYEEATIYIKKLKKLYEKLNKQETYKQYTFGLKTRFKTFRAFIQELNKIDK